MVLIKAFDASKVGDINTLKEIGNLSETLTDSHGATCLHYAARGGSLRVLEFLIKERGFSIFTRSNTGATALHDAAAKGNTAVVKWIVENTEIKVDDQDGAGITSLHLASKYQHLLTVEWIIDEAEGDIDIRSGAGALPLHFAVVGADRNCVKILLDENPRHINMQMNNGTTPVYLACQAGHVAILKYLISRNGATKIKAYDGMSCLHAAAQMGRLEVVKYLINEEKMNPNDRDFDGLTPLHYSTSRGHHDIVLWLMREGGARIALDNLGGSPLHNAAEHCENECIQALLDTGCDVTLTDNDGLTAAELADDCQHTFSASLIRGQTTYPPVQVFLDDTTNLTQSSGLLSPHLYFPPPPAYPPEDDLSPRGGRTTTNTATTNTSFFSGDEEDDDEEDERGSLRSPTPPLPPFPQAATPPPVSSPSTVGSPISPPSPMQQGYNYNHKSNPSTYPITNTHTTTSQNNNRIQSGVLTPKSVDGAKEIIVVQAEIHQPRDIPATPAFSVKSAASRFDQSNIQTTTRQSKTFSTDYNSNTSIEESVIFPSPPPPLDLEDEDLVGPNLTCITSKNLSTNNNNNINNNCDNNYSHPSPRNKVTNRVSGRSSKISQFKDLFESKMTSNGPSKASSFPTQPFRPKEDVPRGASVISISGNKATIVAGGVDKKPKTPLPSITVSVNNSPVVTNGNDNKPQTPSPPPPPPPPQAAAEPVLNGIANTTVTINGGTHDNNKSTDINANNPAPQLSSPSSPSPQSPVNSSSSNGSFSCSSTSASRKIAQQPQDHNHTAAKNDLISDIQSAISGASSLSLRSAKSRGSGVSMVYRKSKEIKENGSSENDAKLINNNVLTGEFDPKNFLDKVETIDSSGRVIPEWRRNVLAKHAAEKALKEFESKKKVDDYESRFKDMPAWKRALIEKREGIAREDTAGHS